MGDRTKIGMDVGHKDNDPLNNEPKNLRNENPSKNRREPRLREKRDAGYPDDSVKIGKEHYIIYKDKRTWYGYEVDKDGNQLGDSQFDPRKSDLIKILSLGNPPRWDESFELDEMAWYTRFYNWVDTHVHKKGFDKLAKQYVDIMKSDKKYKDNPMQAITAVAREYRGITDREFAGYINDLVKKGVLPQELKADFDPSEEKISSFKVFVDKINNK